MKAIILAAGIGTRMGLTQGNIPKCLIKIKETTLLERHINLFKSNNLNDIPLVIGAQGDCWTKKNHEKIQSLHNQIIINQNNLKTDNTGSLNLALEEIKDADDLLIVDGDLILSSDLLKKIINEPNNLILSKETEISTYETRNKIKSNENNKILDIGEQIPLESLSKPYNVYSGLIKIIKKDFHAFKEIVKSNLGKKESIIKVIKEIAEKKEMVNICSKGWFNVNNAEELEKAEKSEIDSVSNPFVILMTGYTGTGKSELSIKLSKSLNTDLFHSAVTRKELNLSPSKENADEFFDYRNNKRAEIDKTVYTANANKAVDSLKNRKNVILDCSYCQKWQRNQIYKKTEFANPDIFIIRTVCPNEEEIKKRLSVRMNNFDKSDLNETPSWNTYTAIKEITESHEEDVLSSGQNITIIEVDTIKNDFKIVKGNENQKNTQKITNALTDICRKEVEKC